MSNAPSRVLIIEDDHNFRKSVSRLVARCGFEAIVAADGNEGAEIIRAGGADIVLTDLKMPGRDGHSVLRELRRRRPAIPAVVMSGVGDMDDVIKALRNKAVDFLAKPFNEDQLADALDRALDAIEESRQTPQAAPAAPPSAAVQTSVPVAASARSVSPPAAATPAAPEATPDEETAVSLREGLRRLLLNARRSLSQLPVLDPRAVEVRELMERPACGVEDILRTIGRDPGLAAAVLKTSNSPAFNTGLPITNLRNACVRLGNRRVISLAMEAMTASAFDVPQAPFRDIMARAWRCALVTARVCDALARHLHRHSALRAELGDPNDLYIAALLHDAGELLLLQLIGKSELAGLAARHLPHTAELIAKTHEDFGAVLMDRWKLRGPVRRLAARHHAPPTGGEMPHHATVRNLVVGSWALAMHAGLAYLPGQEEVDAAQYLGPLGLAAEDFSEVCAAAIEWTAE